MRSSPGDVKGFSELMVRVSSCSVNGVSRGREGEDGEGSRMKRGGGRSERRVQM